MAVIHFRLNKKSLDEEYTRALGRSQEVKEAAGKQFREMFNKEKRKMMRQFDNHPVTIELLSGPRAVNVSNTLDGYGNLFAFIGFDEDSKPTEELRQTLLEKTYWEQTIYRKRGWYFRVFAPTKEEVRKVTPMPWEQGNSWAYDVENDISNLSHFMFKERENSHSGMGYQLPWDYTETNFHRIPYITEILANFRERINNNKDNQ